MFAGSVSLPEILQTIVVILYFSTVLVSLVFMIRHLAGWILNSTTKPGVSGKSIEFYALMFDKYLSKDGATHRDKWAIWMFFLLVVLFLGGIINEMWELV